MTSLWPLELSSNKVKGGPMYISVSKLVDSIMCYSTANVGLLVNYGLRSAQRRNFCIFSVEPIAKIFMPFCFLALWKL